MEIDYEYNEATLISTLLYAEKPFLDLYIAKRVFRYVPSKMIFSKSVRTIYEIIKDLCKTEDSELIGTKQFVDKVRLIAGLEAKLDGYVVDLYNYATTAGTIDYWIKKIQKEYFVECYRKAGNKADFLKIIDEEQEYALETDMVDVSFHAEDAISDYNIRKEKAVFTQYPSINKVIGSFQSGDMVVLAATPGCGKTCMLLNLAIGIASQGKKVDIFSLEMPREQLQQRIICSIAEVNASKFRTFELSEKDKKAYMEGAKSLKNMPIRIFKDQTVGIETIKAIEMKSNSDIVFIDYLGLIDSFSNKASYEKFSDISRTIKLTAMLTKKPFIALHQLNRNIQDRDDKKPRISDLRDSGKIEQDADMILFVHRDFCFDDSKNPEDMNFIVAKNRHGTANITIPLIFNGMYQKITERIKI